jgi:hypothetical protein
MWHSISKALKNVCFIKLKLWRFLRAKHLKFIFSKNRKKYKNNFFLEKNATRVKIEKKVKEVNKI